MLPGRRSCELICSGLVNSELKSSAVARGWGSAPVDGLRLLCRVSWLTVLLHASNQTHRPSLRRRLPFHHPLFLELARPEAKRLAHRSGWSCCDRRLHRSPDHAYSRLSLRWAVRLPRLLSSLGASANQYPSSDSLLSLASTRGTAFYCHG